MWQRNFQAVGSPGTTAWINGPSEDLQTRGRITWKPSSTTSTDDLENSEDPGGAVSFEVRLKRRRNTFAASLRPEHFSITLPDLLWGCSKVRSVGGVVYLENKVGVRKYLEKKKKRHLEVVLQKFKGRLR